MRFEMCCKIVIGLKEPLDCPNLFSWELGNIQWNNHPHSYRCVLGQAGHAATNIGALATLQTIQHWKPRFFFFVGIAGGFKKNHMKLGDIAISDIIWGYEYGKVRDAVFRPRINLTYRADLSLKTSLSFAGKHSWIDKELKKSLRKHGLDDPTVTSGPIASGDKVIDDPSSESFQEVLKVLENTIAVEMEGIGAGLAVAQSQDDGHRVSFLMVRSISDVPDEEKIPQANTQSEQRKLNKPCAAAIAAEFTVSYISSGLPTPPLEAMKSVRLGEVGEKESEEQQRVYLRHLAEINSARLKAQQAILTWQNTDGGIAATQPGQVSGPWTTASCVEALLDGPSIVPACIKSVQGMVDY